MKEIWKDIPSFEGYYQVSNHGRIKALARTTFDKNGKAYNRKEHIVQPSLTRTYYKIHLSKENKLYYFSVHRLVALAFAVPCLASASDGRADISETHIP